jgi:predicted acyltransferase
MEHSETGFKKNRILSIDIFRGLTILTMIFVNDLAGVKDIPGWLKHMPANVSGMTFVDLVFPAFLFIVGMSIPLAMKNRVKRNYSTFQTWKHILLRTAGLIILGVFMVNIGRLNSLATGLSKHWWMLLMFLSVILVWNQYPKSVDYKKYVFTGLKALGLITLFLLAYIYKGGKEPDITWMKTMWWGILGLIGWAYLFGTLSYFFTKDNIIPLIGVLIISSLLYIGDKTGGLGFLTFINDHLWIAGHIGGHLSIVVAGVILSIVFTTDSIVKTNRKKIKWAVYFALFLAVAGYLFEPLYGVNKNLATPAWCLYCSAICTILYVFLFWLVDVKGISKWSRFLNPAGANPLLAYILPDIFYALLGIFGITILGEYFGAGITGIIRAIVLALAMLGLTAVLTKYKVKLQL